MWAESPAQPRLAQERAQARHTPEQGLVLAQAQAQAQGLVLALVLAQVLVRV